MHYQAVGALPCAVKPVVLSPRRLRVRELREESQAPGDLVAQGFSGGGQGPR